MAIQDDATSEVLGACFREQEDAAGYFGVLAAVLERRGVPLAVYSDRHGIFWRSTRIRETIEEELAGEARSTQLGRALGELGIEAIFANSPQAQRPHRAPLGHLPRSPGRRAASSRRSPRSRRRTASCPNTSLATTRASPRRRPIRLELVALHFVIFFQKCFIRSAASSAVKG